MSERISTTKLTKLTLVHLSHTLEEIVFNHHLDALIFTGFQESSYWKQETERYIRLADRVRNIYIFAGKPLPEDSHANSIHVELSEEDPLRQEWFLLVCSPTFSALLCGQDKLAPVDKEAYREFETILTFDVEIIRDTLTLLEEILMQYRPQKAAALRQLIDEVYPAYSDLDLVLQFSMEMIRFQEKLNWRLSKANEALIEQTRLNDLLIELSPAFIVALDGSGNIIALNPSLLQKIYPEWVERENEMFRGLIPVDGLQLGTLNIFKERMLKEEKWSSKLSFSPDEEVIVEWRNRSVRMEDETELYLLIGFDVTEQRRIQEALVRSEAHFREVVTSISQYIYVLELNADGTMVQTYASPQLAQLTGYTTYEVMSSFEFWPEVVIHHDDLEQAKQQFEILARGQNSTMDYRIVRRDGEVRWIRDTAHAVNDPISRKTIIYGVVEDITERKHSELNIFQKEKLRLELEQERELNDIQNKLMTTVSHEFRTPLAAILSSVEIMNRYHTRLDPQSIRHRLHTIEEQVIHMRNMLDDISHVLRVRNNETRFDPREVDLENIVQSSVSEIQQLFDNKRSFALEFENLPELVAVDPRLVRQILRNLLVNAVNYSPPDSTISISTKKQANDIFLEVANVGTGIPPSDLPYIFDPFYRGRNAEHINGTGLGLKLVKDYVTLHKGTIICTSEPDGETVFRIQLPFIK